MAASIMDKAKGLLGHMLQNVRSSNEKLTSSQSESGVSMSLLSPAFEPFKQIPKKYTADGENISPPLTWAAVPWETRDLVLVVEDPDAPMLQPIIHWIVYNIPPNATGLPEAVPIGANVSHVPGARQSQNYNKVEGYSGPKPPMGHGVHHYHFQLFAIDKSLDLEMPSKDDLLKAMEGHVLAHAELVGTYERSAPE